MNLKEVAKLLKTQMHTPLFRVMNPFHYRFYIISQELRIVRTGRLAEFAEVANIFYNYTFYELGRRLIRKEAKLLKINYY